MKINYQYNIKELISTLKILYPKLGVLVVNEDLEVMKYKNDSDDLVKKYKIEDVYRYYNYKCDTMKIYTPANHYKCTLEEIRRLNLGRNNKNVTEEEILEHINNNIEKFAVIRI